jgi:hypothetical protein
LLVREVALQLYEQQSVATVQAVYFGLHVAASALSIEKISTGETEVDFGPDGAMEKSDTDMTMAAMSLSMRFPLVVMIRRFRVENSTIVKIQRRQKSSPRKTIARTATATASQTSIG